MSEELGCWLYLQEYYSIIIGIGIALYRVINHGILLNYTTEAELGQYTIPLLGLAGSCIKIVYQKRIIKI